MHNRNFGFFLHESDRLAFSTAKVEAIVESGVKPRRGIAFPTVSNQRTPPRHSTPRAPKAPRPAHSQPQALYSTA
ncbi:hypothetical protein [Altericista sp. CCNU0014]|uniref:hypothetical protein n=1 Tax=Altericista sp. CCNU0014 TaxID=3082949 RepID=UPI00384F4EE1